MGGNSNLDCRACGARRLRRRLLLLTLGALAALLIAGSALAVLPAGHVATRQGDTHPPRLADPTTDPDLEPGFPVRTYETAGSYHAGPAIHTLVGNIDGDATLEILVTALAGGPLYAWNSDGSSQPGWPVSGIPGAGYPALGELSTSSPGLEVSSAHWGFPGQLVAYNGAGATLPGWPRDSSNYVATPPALSDVDGDGLDEIFTEEEDWGLHAYRANGSVLAGWPVSGDGGQERHTPAIADLDGDGRPEIVTASGWTSPGVYLHAYHSNGTEVAGFPVLFDNGYVDTFPVIGDVDGDGAPEIVVVAEAGATPVVKILSANGTVERSMNATGTVFYGTAPALGDLDGDGAPEIVVQTNDALNVWKGDGTTLPGWPRTWSGRSQGDSGPVIGDVDGDRLPDIAITTQVAGSASDGDVRVYGRNGALHPHFPKAITIGPGGVPAIADIDGDGRNELVVVGSAWGGFNGWYDKVWAYDLHGATYGGIQWGQFGGDAQHDNHYHYGGPPPPPPPPPPPVRCLVPRVIGLKLPKARVRIRRAHCAVGQISRARSGRVGRVIRQRPRAGRRLPRGARVSLVVGRR